MLRIRYVEIQEQYCDSSRDLEVTATPGRPVVACDL